MQLKTHQSKKILKINWKFLETKAIVKPDFHLTIVRQYFKFGVKQKERLPRFCFTPANQHPLFSMQRKLLIIIIIFHFYSAHIDYLSEALYKIILKTAILKFKNKRLKTKKLKI